MTDNPIAEVITQVLADPRHDEAKCEDMTGYILAALEAAGLKVLPVKATEEMRADGNIALCERPGDFAECWDMMQRAFDPTTYTPERSDDN